MTTTTTNKRNPFKRTRPPRKRALRDHRKTDSATRYRFERETN